MDNHIVIRINGRSYLRNRKVPPPAPEPGTIPNQIYVSPDTTRRLGLTQYLERPIGNQKNQEELTPHVSIVKEPITRPPTQSLRKETVRVSIDGDLNHLFYILLF